MNTDKVAGAVQKEGGKIREAANHLVGNKEGEALGRKDQIEGAAREAVGEVKDAVKKASNS